MTGAVVLLTTCLVVYGNAVAWASLSEWAVLVLNLLAAIVVVVAARAFGLSLTEVGLSTAAWKRGWRLGVISGVAVALAIAILAGPLHLFPSDPKVQGMTLRMLAWQVLLRIPFGTALVEETMFRGVLYATWQRNAGRRQAALWSSTAFALWHVVAEMHRQERQGHIWGTDTFTAAIPTFIFLFGAGLLLCVLRERSAGVIAPTIVHWTANSTAAIATYVVSN